MNIGFVVRTFARHNVEFDMKHIDDKYSIHVILGNQEYVVPVDDTEKLRDMFNDVYQHYIKPNLPTSRKTTPEHYPLQDYIYKEDKNMTRKETLEWVANELRCNVDNHFDVALLSIIETLAELNPSVTTSYPCGDIGVNITSNYIELVDVDASKAILALEVNYNC